MRSTEPTRVQLSLEFARAYPVRTLLALMLLGAGLYVLASRLLPSERNNIRAAIEQVRDGILQGDAGKVLQNVSPYFFEEGLDKQALAAWLPGALRGKPVERLVIVLRQIQVQNGTAEANVRVESSHGGRRLSTDWALALEKLDGRWLVRRATPSRVSGYPATGLRTLLRIY
jgi:hypothetical protein